MVEEKNSNFSDELFQNNDKSADFHSNKSLIAGILLFIAGVLGIINFVIYAITSSYTVDNIVTTFSSSGVEITKVQIEQLLLICGAIGIIISIFPILSSILCFKRKLWGFALGSGIIGIFSLGPFFVSSILSIISVILIAQSKNDFNK